MNRIDSAGKTSPAKKTKFEQSLQIWALPVPLQAQNLLQVEGLVTDSIHGTGEDPDIFATYSTLPEFLQARGFL